MEDREAEAIDDRNQVTFGAPSPGSWTYCRCIDDCHKGHVAYATFVLYGLMGSVSVQSCYDSCVCDTYIKLLRTSFFVCQAHRIGRLHLLAVMFLFVD